MPTDDIALLRALAASPRFVESPSLARARATCAHHLRTLGYTVKEQHFLFSPLPARYGMPLIGAISTALVALAWLADRAGHPAFALIDVVLAAAACSALAHWLTSARALQRFAGTMRGVNLEATRENATPRIWLVAHLDSKSQPCSLALRALAMLLTILAWCTGILITIAHLLGYPPLPLGVAFVLAIAGGLPLLFATIGAKSPGAVDNASGVVAVLAAARALADRDDVGVLITDAEELGLAGAHAWAVGRAPGIAINCDSVDDVGMIRVVWDKHRPERLCAAAIRAAASVGVRTIARRIPRGVLTDAAALERVGWSCVTVSRVNWRTLGRIHTMRDSMDFLEGKGIAEAAALLEATARELLGASVTPG